MGITPEEIVEDLEKYIDLYQISLTKEARKTFIDIEQFSYRCNYPSNFQLFFSKVIRNCKETQRFLFSKGINPSLAALQLEIGYYHRLNTENNYQRGTKMYSYIHDRDRWVNTAILDCALKYCVKDEKIQLDNSHILRAAIDIFKMHANNIIENDTCRKDERFSSDYLTLAHVSGRYDESLCIELDEIGRHFNIISENPRCTTSGVLRGLTK